MTHARWERRAERRLTVLALRFVTAYALPILRPDRLSG